MRFLPSGPNHRNPASAPTRTSPPTTRTWPADPSRQPPPATLRREDRRRVHHRQRWLAAVLLTYLASRVVSTVLMIGVIGVARAGSRIGQHATLIDLMTAWDGQWYQLIARNGYPSHLPIGPTGVTTNAWAFLPIYPYLARALALGSPAAWPASAIAVSLTSGAVASVLVGLLVRPRVGDRGAVITAALFAFSPTAFILQTAYAESLGLAMLFAVLVLVDRGHYLPAVPIVAVLSLTRPGVQALCLFLVVHLIARVVHARRTRTSLERRVVARGLVLALTCGVTGFIWPATAAIVTGNPNAYLQTEVAWRQLWTGSATFQPFQAWFYGVDFWFGSAGPLILGTFVAVWLIVLLSPAARRAGTTVRIWPASWSVYLFAVFFPQSSIFRLAMPIAPIGVIAARARTGAIALLILGSVVLQAAWMFFTYGYWTHYWTVP